MTDLERSIKQKLECNLVGNFEVSVQGNKVTISASNLRADDLWDEISAANIFGEESNGWMTSHPDKENVTLSLNKMVL